MKGKTGKPNAMRGGGIARKGVGMALKGGGIARKGTGSNATPGGKKMASGGMSARALPPSRGGSPNPPSDTPTRGVTRPGVPVRGVSTPVRDPATVRPSSKPLFAPGMVPTGPKPVGAVPNNFAPGTFPGLRGAGLTPAQINSALGAVGSLPAGRKNGGKIAKYAKGGSVKMTAGAGSGSGRLEKVAAHKGAKRVPATGLKGGGLSKLLTKISPAAMLLKGELPDTGLLGIGLKGLRSDDKNKGMNPAQVKEKLGLKKGGKVKGK